MVDFIHSFHDLVDRGHQEVGKVNLELEESVVSLPVEKMLEQFVLQKYTGLVSSHTTTYLIYNQEDKSGLVII